MKRGWSGAGFVARVRVQALAAVSLVGALAAVACGNGGAPAAAISPTPAGAFPMTVLSCGRPVTIEDPPRRVLTMGADPAALVWAAGAADRITTRAAEGASPLGPVEAALRAVPQISRDDDLSLESIIGTNVDLVISYGLNLTTPEDLKAAGVDSLVPAGRCDGSGSGENPDGDVDFDDVFGDIELYGRIFSTQDRAAATVAELRERVRVVQERFANAPKRSGVALYLSGDPLRGYGRANMSHTQLGLLGLENVFGDVEGRFFEPSVEELIARDPDVIIAAYGGSGGEIKQAEEALRALKELPGTERLTAVREDHVIPIDFTYLVGSPLAVDSLETMAGAIGGFR